MILILGAIAVAFVVFMIVMIRYAQMKKRRAIEQRRRRRAAERKRRLQEEAEMEARHQRRMEHGRMPRQNPKYDYQQDLFFRSLILLFITVLLHQIGFT